MQIKKWKINSEKKNNNNTVAKDYEHIREFVLEHQKSGVKPKKDIKINII